MKNCTIIYLHGANSTSTSFNFIRYRMRENKVVDSVAYAPEYNPSMSMDQLIPELYGRMNPFHQKDPIFLVGHSLGGVIATLLTYWNEDVGPEKLNILGVVSIASPFGGSKAANFLKWMYPSYGLFDNVATNSPWIKLMSQKGAIVPTRTIITTAGNSPLIREDNDGVVSVKSQMALKNSEQVLLEHNHFEVLLSDFTAGHIAEFIKSHIPPSEFNDLTPTE